MSDGPVPVEPMASKGGRAAAAKMSPGQRAERAKRAAGGRWPKNAPQATHAGELELAGQRIGCVVLVDGRRVLSRSAFVQPIGRTGNVKTPARTGDGDFPKTPPFLPADSLKPFVDKHSSTPSTSPVIYRTATGSVGHGYEARVLPVVCRVVLDARRARVLGEKQRHIADAGEVPLAALTNAAIDALVGEATGFQYRRTRDALQRLLEQDIGRELARRERTFEAEFHRHLYRLKRWPYNPAGSERTPAVGRLTVDLTYDRVHPDLLEGLKQVRQDGKTPNSKRHSWLTTGPTGGHPRLEQHLEGVVALMSVAANWDQFKGRVDTRYPGCNDTPRLPRPDFDESADTGERPTTS